MLACVAVCVCATSVLGGVRASEAPVTYNRQIAPILYNHCTSCHHAGGSGPFALMSYADAKRWGTTVERVTQDRYMPPWLPSEPHDVFADDRRLSAEEIDLIKRCGRWQHVGGAVLLGSLQASAAKYE